ncbi:hypothetical protein HWV62_9261 [Athelia sp. TMB]|nr:hypothetical protein HWV62_9261 [Athelia sp. TMB]
MSFAFETTLSNIDPGTTRVMSLSRSRTTAGRDKQLPKTPPELYQVFAEGQCEFGDPCKLDDTSPQLDDRTSQSLSTMLMLRSLAYLGTNWGDAPKPTPADLSMIYSRIVDLTKSTWIYQAPSRIARERKQQAARDAQAQFTQQGVELQAHNIRMEEARGAGQVEQRVRQAREDEVRQIVQAELWRVQEVMQGQEAGPSRQVVQEEARRARQAKQKLRMVELARKEAAVTIQHIVLDFTVVTFGAGLAIQSVLSGFESCRITIKNLPADATIREVQELFTQQGIERDRFYISGLRTTPSGKQEAYLIGHNDLKMVAIALEHVDFREERLLFKILDHSRGDGTSASKLNPNVLTLSWWAPSIAFLVKYQDNAEAEAKVRELDRMTCVGKRVRVEVRHRFYDGREVMISGLPSDVSDEDVKIFAGCEDIERQNFYNFVADRAPEHVRRYIDSIPGVQLTRFGNVVIDSVGGTYNVRAHFGSWTQARDVFIRCNKRRFPFIGYNHFLGLRLPDPIEYAITIPISQYYAQKPTWDTLLQAAKNGDDANLTIVKRDEFFVIRVGGEDKRAVGSLKVRVERIAAGEKLDGWHPSLSQDFADYVFQDTGAFLRNDPRLRALKVFGEPGSIAAARALVDTELAYLESLEQIVPLKRQSIRFFVTRGLAILKEELGEDNAALDISSVPAKVIIKGGEAARHILRRLIDESLDISNAVRRDAEETTCPICYDSIALPVKLGCGHAYCSACIRHLLTSASSFPLVCMGDEDKCHIPISIPFIQRFLPIQQFNDLLEAAFVMHVDRHPQKFRSIAATHPRKGLSFIAHRVSLAFARHAMRKGMKA